MMNFLMQLVLIKMNYKIIFHPELKYDLKEFSHTQNKLILKQFNKIQKSPELGQALGNKNGYNLFGCQKMYVDKKQIRIVYRVIKDEIIIEFIAVGKRENMQVYEKASKRI